MITQKIIYYYINMRNINSTKNTFFITIFLCFYGRKIIKCNLFLAGFFIRPGPEDPDPQQWILQKKIFLSVFFTFTLPTKVT